MTTIINWQEEWFCFVISPVFKACQYQSLWDMMSCVPVFNSLEINLCTRLEFDFSFIINRIVALQKNYYEEQRCPSTRIFQMKQTQYNHQIYHQSPALATNQVMLQIPKII